MANPYLKVIAVLLGFTFADSAQSARGNVLDQENAPSEPDLNQRVGGRRAQVFSAGATGLLTSVEALLSQTRPVGQLMVEIQTDVIERTIINPMMILGSTSIPISSLPSASAGGTGPQFVSINVTALNVSLTAGNDYALIDAGAFFSGHCLRCCANSPSIATTPNRLSYAVCSKGS